MAEQRDASSASSDASVDSKISVIVPVLNERARIVQRLDELGRLQGVEEVLVVDGGSSDGSLEAARAHPSVTDGLTRIIEGARGRARQMNAGAAAARTDVLLFLHADTQLPPDTWRWITATFSDPQVVFGAFRTWTIDDTGAGRARWLRLADLRSRYTRVPYGDQALFVRKDAFRAVGGFPNQPLMEDTELCLRLRKVGRFRSVPREVRVSGRRFHTRCGTLYS